MRKAISRTLDTLAALAYIAWVFFRPKDGLDL